MNNLQVADQDKYQSNYFNIQLNHAQIDLRYTLASLGFRGGLKSCEQQLGLKRYGLDGIDGYFAIHLWNDYYYNANQKALETLLAYNIEDCINLEKLMQISYNRKIDSLGFENFEKISDNNASFLNSGYLPQINAGAGLIKSNQNVEIKTPSGLEGSLEVLRGIMGSQNLKFFHF